MRILHMIDQASPAATGTTLALMANPLGRLGAIDQRVLLLGGRSLQSAAGHAGLRDPDVKGVPLGCALAGTPAVRRWLQRRPPFDLIHCWSIGSLSLACLLNRSAPKLLTVTTPLSRRALHWLAVLTRELGNRVTLLPISNTLRRQLLSAGIALPRVAVLRPGIDMSRVAFSRRAALREQWGAAEDGHTVIAAIGDPLTATDTIPAATAAYLADGSSATDRHRIRLLVHPRQMNRLRADRVSRNLGRNDWLIGDPRLAYPWQVLPGCDVALTHGQYGGGLSLLWAMSANVPIVGEATYPVCEIIEDRHSGLLAPPGRSQSLAKRISQVLTDPQLAWKIRDTARHEAYSFFSRQHHCQSLRLVYEQAASGNKIEVPPLPQTGGLRFAGC